MDSKFRCIVWLAISFLLCLDCVFALLAISMFSREKGFDIFFFLIVILLLCALTFVGAISLALIQRIRIETYFEKIKTSRITVLPRSLFLGAWNQIESFESVNLLPKGTNCWLKASVLQFGLTIHLKSIGTDDLWAKIRARVFCEKIVPVKVVNRETREFLAR